MFCMLSLRISVEQSVNDQWVKVPKKPKSYFWSESQWNQWFVITVMF